MNTITENRYKLAIYDMPYDTNNRMNYKAWKTIKLLKLLAEEQETRATTAEKQRDRLAEALRNCLPFITGDGCGEYSDAREALQSLTTKEL
jgi:hypothetical protein